MTSIWWEPEPEDGGIVPDYPPIELTPYVHSAELSGPSLDDLRYAGTELCIQRLRDELEASMRSTRRGRLAWWLAGRWPWWRRSVERFLARLARTIGAVRRNAPD